MAKIGLFIPAREPVELPWFDQILADIGDEQSLEQSLSTFSGHIRRISRILDAVSTVEEEGQGDKGTRGQGDKEEDEENISPHPPSPHPPFGYLLRRRCANGSSLNGGSDPRDYSHHPSSLVLLDEVGAGTDPVEGSALAIALLRYLADNSMLTIATTHFGELKALKYQDERFENASVEFDEATLSPTYRLLWGIPGRSNALAIASRLGLKAEVVEKAKDEMGGATDEVNQVIAGLEAQRRRQEEKAAQAQDLLQQAERFYKEVSAKATDLEEREKSLRASQEIAVQQAIASAKGEIAAVIKRLQQGKPTAQDAKKATDNINKLAERFIPKTEPKQKVGFMPKVGERIRIPKLGQTAEVLTAPDEDGEFNVRFGIMKMTVKLKDVESLSGEKAESPAKAKPAAKPAPSPPPPVENTPLIRTSRNTVDLRGRRVADSELILDKAISEVDRAIWIIHGHGTGKLRQGVHAFLKQHPRISNYEAAPQNDGGTGVTIAYIKQ